MKCYRAYSKADLSYVVMVCQCLRVFRINVAVFALGPSDTDVVALPLCRGIDQLSHDDLADFPSLSDGIKKKKKGRCQFECSARSERPQSVTFHGV